MPIGLKGAGNGHGSKAHLAPEPWARRIPGSPTFDEVQMATGADDPGSGTTEKSAGGGPSGSAADGSSGEMLRSGGIVSFMTLLSRILGLFRDRLFAQIFGAGMAADAWNLAFTIPNLTRRLFGEGAMTSAFVPVFVERLRSGERNGAVRTASALIGRVTLYLSAGTAAAIILCILLRLSLPALGPAIGMGEAMMRKTEMTCRHAELMMPYVVLINFAAIVGAMLNSVGHFSAPSLSPVLLNISLIAAMYLAPVLIGGGIERQIFAQSYAVLIGGVLQILVQLPWAFRKRILARPSLDKGDPGYVEIMRNFGPVVFGLTVFQANVLINQLMAWAFVPGHGAVTVLALGNRLVQLPWALFPLALATAALPRLSRLRADGDGGGFARAMADVTRHTLYLSVPSAVGLCICSESLSRLIYGTGEFLANDGEYVRRCGRVVFWYGAGLVFMSLNSILARAHYAAKDTRTPARIAVGSLIVNVSLSAALLAFTNMGESALALAGTASGAYQTFELARTLFVRIGVPDTRRLIRFAAAAAASFSVSCVLAAFAYSRLEGSPAYQGFWSLLAAGAAFFVPLFAIMGPVIRSLGADSESPPPDAALYMAIYKIVKVSILMGAGVWAVQSSLPPEGPAFVHVLQRGLCPVIAGVLLYWGLSSLFEVREYAEMKRALLGRRKAAGEAADGKPTGG